MKVSLKWLSQWVSLEGIDTDDLAHRLTMAGLEHEGTEFIGQGCDDILVGKIESIEPHPKADRLVICQVNTGEPEALRQIVCGATNMKAGDRVPVAIPGSQPPAFDFIIGERKMRGVLSQGMLCSEEELGLAKSSEGLFILPESLTLGQPIFEALDAVDTVLELGLTPNRPDCLSHMGVAREIATLYGRKMIEDQVGSVPAWESTHTSVASLSALEIEDGTGCPAYAMAVVEGVEVGPSPAWLQMALASIGLRSVNNVVDVTNYIMMDVGQPLHAFDLDRLAESKIIVRRATAGEAFVGIDHSDYKLSEEDLVIADAKGAVAIAGVMGSAASEVHDGTTRVLIECAYFNPTTVRKSAKRHGMHTDASHRFERGIDPNALVQNLQRVLSLLLKTQTGTPLVASGYTLMKKAIFEPVTITMPVGMPNRILGTQLDNDKVEQVLSGLGLSVERKDDDFVVSVPTYRPDLERPIDLVEEVARIIGFDALPSSLPRSIMGAVHVVRKDARHAPTLPGRLKLGRIRGATDLLLAQGVAQAVNWSFMGTKDLEKLNVPEDHLFRNTVAVANPMDAQQEMMRTTLLPGLMRNFKRNWSQRRRDIALFEVGRCYWPEQERLAVGMIVSGKQRGHWSGTSTWDFYDVKGLVEALGKVVGCEGKWQAPDLAETYMHPGVQAHWIGANGLLGEVGQLHPSIAQDEGYDQPVFWACVWLDVVQAGEMNVPQYTPMSKYPSVTRDYALLQARADDFAVIDDALSQLLATNDAFANMFKSHEVFDVYEGEHVDADKRSVALQVVYQPTEQTLTEDEIAKLSQTLITYLEANARVSLRE